MDKNEYSIRLEEIKTLIAKQKYAEAAAIADTIDWRRVKKVITLCTISDLYKINRRLEDARDVLLLAYDRHPGGRFIVYSLCELSIKMGSFVEAVEYYKEFVQIAPRDSGRYVLQYKLYEAQEVSLEERIEVLEELKSKDYSEKWAYELAYLYHRIGLGTKCVEECDELILWFGEGKYVQKAMELKQLHAPLTNEQQVKYYQLQGLDVPEEYYQEREVQETVPNEMDWLEAPTKEIPQQELDIQVKLMNVGQYDTINIQKELAQNMKELLGEAPETVLQEEAVRDEPVQAEPIQEEPVQEVPAQEEPIQAEEAPEQFLPKEAKGAAAEYEAASNAPEPIEETGAAGETEEAGKTEAASKEKPTKFDKILGMEYDGQISMLVPDFEKVEKQITGQLRLDEVLVEWEKIKKNSEEKRMEAVRQHVMEQTGAMFTEFEEAARDGLLEQLESENGTFAEETLQEAVAEEPGGDIEEAIAEEPDTDMEEAVESEDLAAGEMLALFDELAKMVEEGGEYETEAIEEVGGYEEEIAEEIDTYEEETDSGADDDNYEESTEYEEVAEESGGYENEVSESEEDAEADSGAEETDDEAGEEAKEDTKDQLEM